MFCSAKDDVVLTLSNNFECLKNLKENYQRACFQNGVSWISLMRDTCMFLFGEMMIPKSASVKENKKGLSYGVALDVLISSLQQQFTFTLAALTFLLIFSLASLSCAQSYF